MAHGHFEVGVFHAACLVIDDADDAAPLVDAVGATLEQAVTERRGQNGFQFAFGFKDNQVVVF